MPKRKNLETKQRLLQYLADGKFHSGEELGRELGISRAAIWKASQYIRDLGLPLESITGRGYRIHEGVELLDHDRIMNELSAEQKTQLNELVIMDTEVSSTNDYLLNHIEQFNHQTIAVLAEQQTKGRGRRGKAWLSPFGRNVYLSLLVPFEKDPAQMLGLSPAVAITLCKTLHEYGVFGASVKWPNDILYNYKKLAGILIEMQATSHDFSQVVIGIGLNLELPHNFQKDLDEHVIDIRTIMECKPERNKLIGKLIHNLLKMIETFQVSGLKTFLPEWNKLDSFHNKPVRLIHSSSEWQGINQGITESGEMMLKLEDGQTRRFVCGEVSLRPRKIAESV